MDEIPKDILKSIFDKVNADDTFSQRIGVKLIELLPGFARATLPITDETINIYPVVALNSAPGFTPLEPLHRCSATGLDFRIIPAGVNAPLEFLTG